MSSRVITVSFLAALAVVPAGAHAQAVTCGWDSPTSGVAIPPGVSRLIQEFENTSRAGEDEAAREGIKQLREWFTGCDVANARKAVVLVRDAASKQKSNTALRALYA